MAYRHISVPSSFATGDANQWFKRFEICSRANEWNEATQALKLPTLLEGEALAIWLELEDEQQKDYKTAKGKIIEKIMPMAFSTLEEFHQRKLHPGEALSVFVHDLKTMLEHAMPDIDEASRTQLLLHQFLTGLPVSISRQLRATGDATDFNKAVERARLLMIIHEPEPSFAAASVSSSVEVEQLKEKIIDLTHQVAALSVNQQDRQPRAIRRCFTCNRSGHIQRDCPRRRQQMINSRRCFNCNRIGHQAKDCWQGNEYGAPVMGSRRPSHQ